MGSICSYPRSEIPKEEDTVWDGMPLQNDRIPGIAKRVGELQAEAYLHEHNWDAVRVIRPANVYGPFDDFNPVTAQVIPALISRLVAGENPLLVWGDGNALRDFVYSEDVAYWLLVALEKAPPSVPINIGAGAPVTIRELVETLVDVYGTAVEIRWQKAGPVGDPVRSLSIARAQELLGYHPRTTLRDGLRRTMRWFADNPDLHTVRSNDNG